MIRRAHAYTLNFIGTAPMTLDLNARYSVQGYPGVTFYVEGYVETKDPETGEVEENDTMVRAIMVGDDRVHLIDVDDLTLLDDGDYCPECVQIGCEWYG